MDGDREEGDFGRGGLERDDVELARETDFLSFRRGDGRRRFLTLLKVRENEFPERDPRDFGLLLYDGVISDEEFVRLYNEIYLSALILEREWSSLH